MNTTRKLVQSEVQKLKERDVRQAVDKPAVKDKIEKLKKRFCSGKLKLLINIYIKVFLISFPEKPKHHQEPAV
jgi:hypothetical protein